MRRRKKYDLEFMSGIYDEWRFYDVLEKMLIRSQEYEKAMKTTCALMTKIKDKVSEDIFEEIEGIVNSVCTENSVCSKLAYSVGVHDGIKLCKELQIIDEVGGKIK